MVPFPVKVLMVSPEAVHVGSHPMAVASIVVAIWLGGVALSLYVYVVTAPSGEVVVWGRAVVS